MTKEETLEWIRNATPLEMVEGYIRKTREASQGVPAGHERAVILKALLEALVNRTEGDEKVWGPIVNAFFQNREIIEATGMGEKAVGRAVARWKALTGL